jgi:hypothetical protein
MADQWRDVLKRSLVIQLSSEVGADQYVVLESEETSFCVLK